MHLKPVIQKWRPLTTTLANTNSMLICFFTWSPPTRAPILLQALRVAAPLLAAANALLLLLLSVCSSARALTDRIRATTSLEELRQVVEEQAHRMTQINLAVVIQKVPLVGWGCSSGKIHSTIACSGVVTADHGRTTSFCVNSSTAPPAVAWCKAKPPDCVSDTPDRLIVLRSQPGGLALHQQLSGGAVLKSMQYKLYWHCPGGTLNPCWPEDQVGHRKMNDSDVACTCQWEHLLLILPLSHACTVHSTNTLSALLLPVVASCSCCSPPRLGRTLTPLRCCWTTQQTCCCPSCSTSAGETSAAAWHHLSGEF